MKYITQSVKEYLGIRTDKEKKEDLKIGAIHPSRIYFQLYTIGTRLDENSPVVRLVSSLDNPFAVRYITMIQQ